MINETTRSGTVELIERLPSSKYGNPRFLLSVGGYVCRTAPDSPLGYSVRNFDGKAAITTTGDYHGKPTLLSIRSPKS